MADSYVDVLVQNDAEGGTDGAAVSTGNSGGASGRSWNSVNLAGTSQIVYTDDAIHGGMSIHIIAGGMALVRWTESAFGALTRCCGTAYINLDALPSGYTNFIEAHTSTAGNTDRAFALRVSSAGSIRLTDAATGNVFSSASGEAVVAGVTYRYEWDINHTAGTYDVAWFLGDSTTPIGRYQGSGAFGDATRMLGVGRSTSPDVSMRLDSIAIDSKPVGPREVPRTTVRPIAVAANPGGYTAVGGLSVLGAVRDESDATLVRSPNTASTTITYELGARSAGGVVTGMLRLAASAAATQVTLELVNLDTSAVLGTANVTVGTSPADYTVVSGAAVATGVKLGLRITKA